MGRLVTLLEEEKTAYARLRDLTREQMAVVKTGDVEALERLVDEKQRLIDRIEELEREALPLRTPTGYRPDRDTTAIMDEIRHIIRDAIEVEQGQKAVYEERKTETMDALREMHRGQKAISGYRQHKKSTPRFVDKTE